MARIPYPCYLGYVLRNKVNVDCFQYFRDRQNWKWSEEEQPGFQLINPQDAEKTEEVNILIEVSGFIDKDLVPRNPFTTSKQNLLAFYSCKARGR